METELFKSLFSLKGKAAVITGGYNGIGKLFSETYAQAGADIAIVARNHERCQAVAKHIKNKYGIRAIARSLDVNDSKAVDAVIAEIIDTLGHIDILVNSAGISGNEKPVLSTTDEEMDSVMNVDYRGTFLVSRAVAKGMSQRKSGKIINISSILGKISSRNMAGYCASKAAVIQLTKVMALELMRDNIQVNVLCPGYFLTDFNEDFFKSDVGKKMVKKMIPMGRVGNLKELQSTALYLGAAPAFLTGAELYIDGGHTIV